MPEEKKNFDWKKLCSKLWTQGIHTALKEEVCPIIPTQFDEMGLEVLDKLVTTFLSEKENTEE